MLNIHKTHSSKQRDTIVEWYIIDAKDVVLGRLATTAAKYLAGKNKVDYTPNINPNVKVVVINAEHIKVTGNKVIDKIYYRHSGYPGGLKELSLKQLKEKDSRLVIEYAVRGMLPKNKLQTVKLANLYVYKEAEHDLKAQEHNFKKVEVS